MTIKITTENENIMPRDEQMRRLKAEFRKQLKDAGWIRGDGNIRKSIPFKSRNINIENIEYDIHPLRGMTNIYLVELEFDIHFKTAKQEAIKHFDSNWSIYGARGYNIGSLGSGLRHMMNDIKTQLIFTDSIDKNLYDYYELNDKGWMIL